MSIGTQKILDQVYIQKQAAAGKVVKTLLHAAKRDAAKGGKALLEAARAKGNAAAELGLRGAHAVDSKLAKPGLRLADFLARSSFDVRNKSSELLNAEPGFRAAFKNLAGRIGGKASEAIWRGAELAEKYPRTAGVGIPAALLAGAAYGGKKGVDAITEKEEAPAESKINEQIEQLKGAMPAVSANSLIAGGGSAIAGGLTLGALARVLAPEKYKRLATVIGGIVGATGAGAAGLAYGGDTVGKIRDKVNA